LSQLKRK